MQKLSPDELDSMVYDEKIPIRIAFVKPDGIPNVVSLWHVILNGKIYCATQKSAKIVSFLKNNPRCGFEIASDKPPYRGVRGEGHVNIVEENAVDILELLIEKYLGKKESALSKFLRDKSASEVSLEITPQKILHFNYSKRMRDI
ncbi:MAG: pyridoxamine 5'-phosphate oxidase family protein [Nitrosopumilus sp.]|nr:pyridoxamine 5'-phosphate oxidase family protein [Nitrosopumilus sp.]